MKQLKYYMMMLAALLTFGSCSDDDDPAGEAGAGTQISLSSNTLQVGEAGGTVSVTVTSDADWRLAGICDWARPSATEGQSGDEVTFTVDKNTTGEKLSTTFKFFTGASVAPLVIESVMGNTFALSSEETMEVEQAGGQVVIKLKSNIANLDVAFGEGGAEWLTFDRQSSFADEQLVILNVSANEGYLERFATVTVSSSLVEETAQVTISQAPTEMFEVTQENLEGDMIIGDLSAQTIQFQVVTNLEFTASITEGSEWISEPQISEPVTAENGLSTYTVSVNLESSTITRAGSITFNANGTQSYSIIQKDPNVELVEISSDFSDELVDMGWILPIGERFIVLDAGLNATVFDVNVGWSGIEDLTGIDQFPNLETIQISCSYYLETFDISGLHKVNTLNLSYASSVELYNLGDNPIVSINYDDYVGSTTPISVKFVSEKLETLNCNISDWEWDGSIETIDVSECPALKTLVADQCSSYLETIIVKEGQNIDITKPDDVAIEYR